MRQSIKQQAVANDSTEAGNSPAAAVGKLVRKAPGTRVGILLDWREGSRKSGKVSGGLGKTLRDGR
jgi:hypothetical protein